MNSIEFNGLESTKKVHDYKKYHREWQRKQTNLTLRQVVANELKTYLDEYNTWCLQNLVIPDDLHDFIIHFTRIGFNEWKNRTKGK